VTDGADPRNPRVRWVGWKLSRLICGGEWEWRCGIGWVWGRGRGVDIQAG